MLCMNKHFPFLLSLLLGPAVSLVLAEAPSLRVEVDRADGSRLLGTPGITSVLFQTAYARLDLPLAQLGSLQLGADRETVACRMQNVTSYPAFSRWPRSGCRRCSDR